MAVSPGSGHFEVLESGSLVASGRVSHPDHPHQVPVEEGGDRDGDGEEELRLSKRDVYKELRLRGYDYGPTFQGILSAHNQGECCLT